MRWREYLLAHISNLTQPMTPAHLFRATEALGLGPTDHDPSTKRRLDISRREKGKATPNHNPHSLKTLLLPLRSCLAEITSPPPLSRSPGGASEARQQPCRSACWTLTPRCSTSQRAALHMNINCRRGPPGRAQDLPSPAAAPARLAFSRYL